MPRPPHDIRLVLADVDGTLVTREKILTPRAIRAVQALRERDILFAITSGRPPRGMAMLIEPLGLTTPLAGFNGGMMVQPDMQVISALRLPRTVAEKTLALLKQHNVPAWVYTSQDWLVPDASAPHVAREQWTVKFPPRVTSSYDDVLDDVIKITGVSDDAELMRRVANTLAQELGASASAALSQPYYVDITHPDANKGGVVHALERLLNIPATAMLTVGDQPNDVLMFRASGTSIAMGQATDSVQTSATWTTASSEEDGFAKGIERFVLGED
ncbi:MAG: Cof-type HAD-IIB family hydrolase [Acetobacter malorum]|uniref:Cof-type HAD-IIB family hydrolase n=1 Tax=Acetobacter malorum TaxID=178901 RepID=UPI0039E9D260